MSRYYKFLFNVSVLLSFTAYFTVSTAFGQQTNQNQTTQELAFFSPLYGSALNTALSNPDSGEGQANYASSNDPQQQERGEVAGTIVDAGTGEALIGASIILRNTAIGAVTNYDGEFLITRLPAGEQVLIVRYLGYVTQELVANVVGGERITLNIRLQTDTVMGEEIVIQTQALGQANAIRQQVNSNTIVNVVSETRLRELPDANAAESIGRLPGVAILRDAGEGSRVAIRGMGPRFSSITIDGNRVPGTDDDRSVNLSMISPEMLAGIEVYKAIRPDMDADAIGGSVNFRMGGAPDETRYRLNIGSGYNNQLGAVGRYNITASASSRFLDNRLGVMGSLTAEQVERSAHVLGSSYSILRDAREGEPHAPIEVTSLNLTDMSSTRNRLGGGLSLDWRLKNGRLFFNNTYSSLDREDLQNRRNYSLSNNRQEWRPRKTLRETSTLNSTLSGRHQFTWLEIDWRLNRSVTTNDIPYDHQAWFFEPSAFERTNVDFATIGPDAIPPLALNRTERAFLETFLNEVSFQKQENLAASLDFTIPVNVSRYVSGYVKLGGKHYDTFRERNTLGYRVYNWETPNLFNDPESPFPWVINQSGRASMIPFISQPDRSFSIVNGNYEMAHLPAISFLDMIWGAHENYYRTQAQSSLNDYRANERLSAAYIMTELNIGSRLMILPGVRYEHEHSDYTAPKAIFSGNLQDLTEDAFDELTVDSTASRNKGMVFPMVQARFRVTDWFDVRAARTVSTSRPSFNHMSPRFFIGYDAGTVRRGNTQIKPMRATNYDLFLTVFHNRLGLFTVGGFYKEIEDLIYTRNANVITPAEIGLPANTRLFEITEPVNNENLTTVHGFEIEWQSNLTWLPNPFNGLVVNANMSRFFSEANYHSFEFRRTRQGIVGIDTFRVAPMIHQADLIANLSLGYDYKGFSSRVSVQFQGATLRSVGSRPETDRYTDDYLRYDASIRQRFFNRRLSIYANLNNVTNRADRSSQFTYDRPRTIEYYGASFDVGMEITF
ncbi:MAG: TonB-dependent receptor [Bacteroidetes bacterium]|nr:TonB-dependent receptor [Bacteroidota bacterium]MCH8523995.1 TonB-dependent receptor [Balneolales bacterium]